MSPSLRKLLWILSVVAGGGGLWGEEKPSGPTKALHVAPGAQCAAEDAPLQDLFRVADPTKDKAWGSEALADIIGKRLKTLALAYATAGQMDETVIKELAAPEFKTNGLRGQPTERWRDASLVVRRSDGAAPLAKASLVDEVKSLASIYPATTDIHTKFKIIRVSNQANTAETVAYFQSDGQTAHGIVQQSATWTCQWQAASKDSPPVLTSLSVTDYEEVLPLALAEDKPTRTGGAAPLLFQDMTEAVLSHVPAWKSDLQRSADHWYGTLDVTFNVHQGNHGLSVCDIDNDGREDLYLTQSAGLKNRMLHQLPDGRFEDVSDESGLAWLDNSRSAAFADLDNDGDQDAVVTIANSAQVFESDGFGHFRPRAVIEIYSWPSSIAVADYDNDGDLDLYLCGYNPRGETAAGDIFANPVPYHDANNGARNFMMENLGNFDFKDTTTETGLDQNNRKFSFAAVWEDFDNDGDQDLFVANDFGRKNLYRNDLITKDQPARSGPRRPKFVDIATEAGVADLGSGMSVSWSDYDHDGLMDLYVANMFSSAGNRIATQLQFKNGEQADQRADFLRHARGNSLFRNKGDGTFEDVSETAGVTLGRWAWGSLFVDFNNDTWEDIYVANGFFTQQDPEDL